MAQMAQVIMLEIFYICFCAC